MGIAVLIIFVIGATYAYFQVVTGNGSSTIITATTPKPGNLTITKIGANLHLNLKAEDMSKGNEGREYYATNDEKLPYVGKDQRLHNILEVSLEGEETYTCTGEILIDMDVTSTDNMGSVLKADDMYLYLESSSHIEELDLSDLLLEEEKGKTKYEIKFEVSNTKRELIQTYVKLKNKETPQDDLAGKTLNVDIKTENIQCEIGGSPKVKIDEEKTEITPNSITINVVAEEGSEIANWYYKIDKENENNIYATEVANENNPTKFTHTFEGLEKETQYTISVYAKDKLGKGIPSSAVNKTYTTPKPTAADYIKEGTRKPNDGSVDWGDLKTRFVGIDVNNYICFGTTDKEKCKNDAEDKYMYRIIGTTKDGMLKVMKQTSIGDMQWHTSDTDDARWNVEGYSVASLYTYLNTTFLNNTTYIPNDWSSKIADIIWNVGDGVNRLTGNDVLKDEEKMKTASTAKIGLINLSDYYFATTASGANTCRPGALCESWMANTITKRVLDSAYYGMLTMNRYTGYAVHNVHYNGSRSAVSISRLGEVRPVFYIKSTVELTGSGTIDDPYRIILPDSN